MGAKVDVFEPNRLNNMRLCESICLNNFGSCETTLGARELDTNPDKRHGDIRVFRAGIGRMDGEASFHANSRNPGMGSIIDDTKAEELLSDFEVVSTIQIRPLDAMASQLKWYDEPIDILKIDVEGFEGEVFEGAKNFLKARTVRNIFMEGDVSSKRHRDLMKEIIEQLVDAGYGLLKMGGYSGPTEHYELPIDDNFSKVVSDLCRNAGRKPRNKCNMWWQLQ